MPPLDRGYGYPRSRNRKFDRLLEGTVFILALAFAFFVIAKMM